MIDDAQFKADTRLECHDENDQIYNVISVEFFMGFCVTLSVYESCLPLYGWRVDEIERLEIVIIFYPSYFTTATNNALNVGKATGCTTPGNKIRSYLALYEFIANEQRGQKNPQNDHRRRSLWWTDVRIFCSLRTSFMRSATWTNYDEEQRSLHFSMLTTLLLLAISFSCRTFERFTTSCNTKKSANTT